MKYHEANAKLQGRCFHSRKVGNHTYLERDKMDKSIIYLRLHATRIITWRKDGSVILKTGGWDTPTTKERLNSFGPIHIYCDHGVWLFRDGDWIERRFHDGMKVHPDGTTDAAEYRRMIPNDPIVLADLKARNIKVRTHHGQKYAYA